MWIQEQSCNEVRGKIEDEKDDIPRWGELCAQHFDPVKLVSFSLAVQNQKSDHWWDQRQMRDEQ